MPLTVKKFIPSIITLSGLFLGFSSILFCLQSLQDLVQSYQLHMNSSGVPIAEFPNPQRYLKLAGLSILFVCFIDSMDGFVARRLKVESAMGKELDSFADFVSFGIAPGILFYTVVLFAGETLKGSGIAYRVSPFIPEILLNNIFIIKLFAFLFPICAVIRLARFNQSSPKDYFFGFPSTYAGAAVAMLLTFNFYNTPSAWLIDHFWDTEIYNGFILLLRSVFNNLLVIMLLYIFFALMMISNIKFPKIYLFFRLLIRRKILWPTVITYLILFILFFKYVVSITIFAFLVGAFVYHCVNRKTKSAV